MAKVENVSVKVDSNIKDVPNSKKIEASDINEIVDVINKNDDIATLLKNSINDGTAIGVGVLTQNQVSTSFEQWVESSGGGTISNAPDEEDLTVNVDNKLLFKDRSPQVSGQLGYKVIRPNFDFTQDLSAYANSILEIRYVHDLDNSTITLPDNVTLKFNGGKIINGTIIGNNTILSGGAEQLLGKDITPQGTWDIIEGLPEWFGAKGDNIEDDFIAFQKIISISKNIKILNKTYKLYNTTPLVLREGMEIKGNGTLRFTNKAQRFILAENISYFSIKDITIDTDSETSIDYIGGGYVRLISCTDFIIDNLTIKKTAWDGIKVGYCSDFTIKNCSLKYTKSSAIQIEACTDFKILNNDLSKNGLNSTDDSYADLPGGSVSHLGRGLTVYNGSVNGVVKGNRVVFNTEYGLRLYAAVGSDGSENISFIDNYIEDNGHPAGTYGSIVLTNSKGVDLLINNGGSEDKKTEGIRISGNKIVRNTKNYGTTMSLHCYDSKIDNNEIIHKGLAINSLSGIFLYGAYNCVFDGNTHRGVGSTYAIGTEGTTDCVIKNEVSLNCNSFFIGTPLGFNVMSNIYAKHNESTAISGHYGLNSNSNWRANDVLFDGFYRGLEFGSINMYAKNIQTINSSNLGIRNYAVNGSNCKFIQCDFDSHDPNDRSNVIYDSNSSQGVTVMVSSSIPTQGYYKLGSFVFNTSYLIDANNMTLLGWKRMTSGSSNTLNTDWKEVYVSVVSPAN